LSATQTAIAMNADHESRNQAARYRWLGRNINDAEMKAILEAAATDLEEHAACVERGQRENWSGADRL
jgi:hypothetical protein